jgi:membrane associated rhomboid family serine protease
LKRLRLIEGGRGAAPASAGRKVGAVAIIAGVTAAVWLVAAVTGFELAAIDWGGFVPARFALGGGAGLAPFWLTPLTAPLIHFGLIHLAMNLLFLFACGRPVEAALGPFGLAALYLAGALAAAGAHYAADPSAINPMVGAEGAISAVVGGYAMLFGRRARAGLWLNALWLLVAWLGLQLLIGAGAGEGLPIGRSLAAVVAGLAGGFVAGFALANPLLLLRYRGA